MSVIYSLDSYSFIVYFIIHQFYKGVFIKSIIVFIIFFTTIIKRVIIKILEKGVRRMLENITPISFAPYGSVMKNSMAVSAERLGYSIIKTREICHGRFSKLFYHPEKKSVLDITDGTAILFVGKKPSELKTFLLDKLVEIKEGIYYYVVPLIKTAVIAIAAPEDLQQVNVRLQDKPAGIIPVIEPKEIYTFFYHEKERGFVFKGEKHDFWELTYVDRGEMYNIVDGVCHKLTQGGMMLFAPGQFHSQHADKNVNVCYVTVSFRMDNIDEELFKNNIFMADGEIKTLVGKMLSERDSERIFADDLMLCYLKEIIISLARTKRLEKVVEKAFAPVKQNIESDIVESAKIFIKQNISRRFGVSDVASSIPISEGYLSALFKKNMGITLNSYITDRKMEVAKAYIREGRFTFTQISNMVGYNNVHYFSSSFKKHFGMTPTEYANAINQK